MTRANYPAVMAEIFKHEGGYVDHPSDPGGATNMGITFAVLQEWRGKPITKADVKALSKAEASLIYEARYWAPIKGDSLPAGIDLVTMDGSVNSGIGRGPKWVQTALHVTVDGKVGPTTITAANVANKAQVINDACDARMAFLRGLKTWPTFGKGWESRVKAIRSKALQMAATPVADLGPIIPPPIAPIPTHPAFPQPDVEPIDTPAPQPKSHKGLWLIGLIVVVVLVAAVFSPILKG